MATFVDFDGDVHPADESWEFLGYSFLPHDDGLSLFVSSDGRDEWNIRLQWRSDQQAYIIEHLDQFIAPERTA